MVKVKTATPGEKVSVIEEFDSGEGTYLRDGEVRSLRVGEAVPNLTERIISIKPVKSMDRLPRPGDTVIGVVETAQASIMNIRIELINGKYSQAGFTGMLQLGAERSSGRGRVRRGSVCKRGDLIRARVFSDLNSIIHLSIDGADDGVIHTVCSLCGGDVVRIRDRVKCIECGNVEERKLASNFGIHGSQ
ncbi:MAG: exosome complex RNA-binding protein Csl4 [Nitrososphaerales archaeon]